MKDLVSIIVPIYNTEQYLERCLESLCNQTYKNVEIILLNDGSTDGSLEKCLQWAHKDERIIVVHKKNEKQGPTRDLGVRMASGKYLLFVDSDDWVERDYAELLYTSVYSNQADIAFCDFDYTAEDGIGGKAVSPKKSSVYLEHAVSVKEKPSLLYSISVSLCNKIFRSAFWRKTEIVQHKGGGEDACVCAQILPMADKISQVRKILYHYCYNSKSTTNQQHYEQEYLKPLKIIRGEQKRVGLDSEAAYAVKKLASSTIPYNAYSSATIKDSKKREFLRKYFIETFEAEGDIANAKAVVWGSFNLRCVLKEYMYFIPDSYTASSLTSLMSEKPDNKKFTHDNKFREDAVKKEMDRCFLEKMLRCDYIFIDFLEERYDILALPGKVYITLSDAYLGGMLEGKGKGRVISNGSEEYMECWKQSCRRFIDILKKISANTKIVMVRTRLSEWYGGYGREEQFSSAAECREKNHMFEEMENYFLSYYQDAIVVDNEDTSFLYTDKDYPYGCHPYHLNGYWYRQAGELIKKELEKRKDFQDE